MTIVLNDESTWPAEVISCLNHHHDILYSWESRHAGLSDASGPAYLYDQAHAELREALNPFLLRGYHCTRITEDEISCIRNNGMMLQNLSRLSERIDNLVQDNLLSPEIANRLKLENQADDNNRAGILWFCFFLPKEAGEDGIERFFRSWGGEALYNSHESDAETGPVLRRIGIPCVIEADVPISNLSEHCFLTIKISRVFLKNRGLNTRECCHLEADVETGISSDKIRRIIQFSEPEFVHLTGCNEWHNPITLNDLEL